MDSMLSQSRVSSEGDRRGERGSRSLVALVLHGSRQAGSSDRLVFGVAGKNAEADWNAGALGDRGQAVGGACADVVEVWSAAADHDAERDDRVESGPGQAAGGDGEFEDPWYPDLGDVSDLGVLEGAAGAVEETVHDFVVPAAGDDRNLEARCTLDSFIGRCSMTTHACSPASMSRSWPI